MINKIKNTFSIIIPCHNEDLYLQHCLRSLMHMEYPKENFEVIVVDNGSTDQSLSIAEKYADRVICLPDAKVGAVRNAGAKIATGKFLVFIDADCTLDNQWLARAETLVEKSKDTVFGGGITLPENANWVERHWLLEGALGNTLPSDLIGCSIVIHSDQFKRTCGFNEHKSSGEDTDLAIRIRNNGTKILITRALNVTHLGNAKTISSHIIRQAWHAQSYKKRKWEKLKDAIFLLVINYILLISLALVFLIIKLYLFFLFSATLFLLSPLILTTKRYFRAQRKPVNLREIFLAYILDLTYLTGRAIGYLTPPYR
jgi:glycosyltransferase involved in cell wall biosynthesis